MKPCASRRESVALFACGACSADQAADLRRHLQACPRCREYFRRLSQVCEDHATAAAQLPEARVPSRLSSRVASRIRTGPAARRPARPPGVFVGWARIAGWAMLLGGLVVGAIWTSKPVPLPPTVQVTESPQPPPGTRVTGTSKVGNSLVAYRLALDRSPEALEELLSEEAAKPAPNPQIVLRTGPELQEFEL